MRRTVIDHRRCHGSLGRLLPIAVLASFCALGWAVAAPDKKGELKEIRARIEGIRKSIEADTLRRDALAGDLKNAELAVQSSRVKIAEVRNQRSASERQLSDLRREQAETGR